MPAVHNSNDVILIIWRFFKRLKEDGIGEGDTIQALDVIIRMFSDITPQYLKKEVLDLSQRIFIASKG